MPVNRFNNQSGPMRIGIIGGGASAVCLLDALSQGHVFPSTVTVFEPSPHLWRGRPYQPDVTTVRVNAPPDDMSVRFGDIHHFESWLAARQLVLGNGNEYADPWSGARFVPRATFGDYLEQSARTALMHLVDQGCRVDLVREVVTGVGRTGSGLELHSASGAHEVDYVVLCVGGAPPADLYRLAGLPGFVPDPYPVSHRLGAVNPDHDVAVIGSGLTGVDIVLSLAARGHRGRISLLSRQGVLPAVRQRPVHYRLRHFTPSRFRAMAARQETCTLLDLLAVMRRELADAGVRLEDVAHEVTAAGSEDPVVRLRRQLTSVDEPGLGLRILQRAVPDTGPDVWPLLPEQDKKTLLRSHYRAIMSLCCPMPPASAAVLLSLVDAGQLEIVRGLSDIKPEPGAGFRVATADGDRNAQVVVNAVNAPAHRIPPRAEPLITSLLAGELARRHPRGGLHVERATSRLVVGDRPDPRLYALGDLAAGSLFFTFGVPSLVDRAYDIAGAILRHAAVQPARGDAMQAA